MYIDEVAVTKKTTGDDTPPIITVKADDINANVGTYPIEDYTVTDNSGRVNVSLKWSKGALDGKGRLTVGTHTCVITATDDGGNETKKLSLIRLLKKPNLLFIK